MLIAKTTTYSLERGFSDMKNTTHRVVILKNINSATISQAILILKDSANENETALIAEAERIVEKYMNGGSAIPPNNRKKTAAVMSAGIILITLALFIAGRFF